VPDVGSATVPVLSSDGREVAKLHIKALREFIRIEDEPDSVVADVQLLEDAEYEYLFAGVTGRITTDHADVFSANRPPSMGGRLKPWRNTGTVTARVRVDDQELGTVSFEVRSRKLNYKNEYRWMMRDLAEGVAEAMLMRFAAGGHWFQPDLASESRSVYQQFAFLSGVLDSPRWDEALERIHARPHLRWATKVETRSTARAVAPTSGVVRQMASRQPRVPLHRPIGGLSSLPRTVEVKRTEATTDTVPNQFVRFVLESFLDTVSVIESRLDENSPRTVRGRLETARLRARLERRLASPLMRSVSRLTRMPAANQVLQKRAGYRDVLAIWLQSQLAGTLTWTGGEDVYSAGTRNVAALYEYWCFLQLVDVLSALCDRPFDVSSLIGDQGEGLTLALKSGHRAQLSSRATRNGVRVDVDLSFNETYERKQGSWTLEMRPDYTVVLTTVDRYDVAWPPVRIHFDAKYRVTKPSRGRHGRPPTPGGGVKRDDLLKMHAYRDAIRESAGAYVLFPGERNSAMSEYNEVLPGLGAFTLRPSEAGAAQGAEALSLFLEGALAHVAEQTTEHERTRYWSAKAHGDRAAVHGNLSKPPADTPVVLGLAKTPSHLEWTETGRRYCVRADLDRLGGVALDAAIFTAEYLVLYLHSGAASLWRLTGKVEFLTRQELIGRGYPGPGGNKYIALVLDRRLDWQDAGLPAGNAAAVSKARLGPNREPPVLSWADLVRELAESTGPQLS
jgi:uncharacterized protein